MIIETKEYYPGDEILKVLLEENEEGTMFQKRTISLLGKRRKLMYYPVHAHAFSGAFIIDAMMAAESTLGVEIASALNCLIAEGTSKKICCLDLVNPFQIPGEIYYEEGWKVKDPEKVALFEDEDYLVGIEDSEQEVKIFLYRK